MNVSLNGRPSHNFTLPNLALLAESLDSPALISTHGAKLLPNTLASPVRVLPVC